MRLVVRRWAANLDAENNAGEGRLFRYPVMIETGPGLFGVGQCWCLTRSAVFEFHADIPCGVKIVSIGVRRRYATAVFRLGDRLTSKCSSAPTPMDLTGWFTAVRFTIVRGKITVLKQIWWKPPGQAAIRAHGR